MSSRAELGAVETQAKIAILLKGVVLSPNSPQQPQRTPGRLSRGTKHKAHSLIPPTSQRNNGWGRAELREV
jgi:hypothetical protein